MLRTLRTIFLLALTLVFFGVGQTMGGFFEGAMWFMAFSCGALAFSTA